jgi:predicted unusual protein kinase regulating ubiquinone biosynthesis (AarF/ABC1/UbiB family)
MNSRSDNKSNSVPVDDVIQAIPEGMTGTSENIDPLGDLIARISNKRVPVNSLNRLWALGGMQAKVAVGYIAYALRSSFTSSTEKEKLLNEMHLKAALEILGTMGYLRGAVMKIGQLLANMPHIIPEKVADTLEKLQFEAPPMHFSLIREVFLDEFGKDPSELFASFDKKAFAAASLGQVHKATLKTGEEVAVKIQYPNMAATIRSDLANLRKVLMPMKLHQEGRYITQHLSDIESVLVGETDYRAEASFMKKARGHFSPEDMILVPRVWDEFSTDRVLTTDFLKGRHAGDFLKEDPDQDARNHFGTLISRAIFRIWSRDKTIYADPNPGNFLFLEDGRLGLIDFGCCRTLTEEEWQLQIDAEDAWIRADEATMLKLIAKACLYDDHTEMELERQTLLLEMGLWQAEPAAKEGLFSFGDRDFYQRGIDLYIEATKRGYIRNNSLYIWWTRLIIGHRTLLYRLDSNVDYHKIYNEERSY